MDSRSRWHSSAPAHRPAPPQPAPSGARPPDERAPHGTTLLLVRHGATAHTAQRRFSGCTGDDPPLAQTGRAQASRLADTLAAAGIDAVVCSPMRRTRQTAEILARAVGVPTAVDEDLREIDFGAWEGRTGPEVDHGWPGGLTAWRADPATAPPGGESVTAVAHRVAGVRRRLADAHPGGTVLLVSHLYPVRLSVLDALRAPYESVHRMLLEPTAVTQLRVAGGDAGTLVRYNDTGHLRSS